MNNLAKKIREVVEVNKNFLVGYGASERAVQACEVALITGIIEEIDKRIIGTKDIHDEREILYFEGINKAHYEIIADLKEAREELINNE